MIKPYKQLYEFDDFQLDPLNWTLSKKGNSVPLKPKVFRTLVVLVENSGNVVPKTDLMNQVWPDTNVMEENLTHNISVLRKVLGKDPQGNQYIETVPTVGYRFTDKVRVVQIDEVERGLDNEASPESNSTKGEEIKAQHTGEELIDERPSKGNIKHQRVKPIFIIISVALLLVLGIIALAFSLQPKTPQINNISILSKPSPGKEFYIGIKGTGFDPETVQVIVTGPGCMKFGSCTIPNNVLGNYGNVTEIWLENVPLTVTAGDYQIYVQNSLTGKRSNAWPLTVPANSKTQ